MGDKKKESRVMDASQLRRERPLSRIHTPAAFVHPVQHNGAYVARPQGAGQGRPASIKRPTEPGGSQTRSEGNTDLGLHSSLLTLPFEVDPPVLACAAKVKLVLFDVDGVLTDGQLILGDDGQEYKSFNSLDGHGIKMLQRNGVAAGIITGRTSRVVEHRMEDLGVAHVYQGCLEKLPAYRKLIDALKLHSGQTAFVGDDVVDLPIMLQVGFAVAVQNAHPLVKRHAHWTTPSAGGCGAVREICELILYAHGAYDAEMQTYLIPNNSG